MNIFNKQPFLIGEIGVNFYDIAKKENISDLDAAKIMIKQAKDCGIDAVKFQSYKAETIASKSSSSYWDLSEESTTSQFDLFKKFDKFGRDEYKELADYCREIGIIFLATPFDFESVDYLDEFMDIYKISSSDLTNIPFIKRRRPRCAAAPRSGPAGSPGGRGPGRRPRRARPSTTGPEPVSRRAPPESSARRCAAWRGGTAPTPPGSRRRPPAPPPPARR